MPIAEEGIGAKHEYAEHRLTDYVWVQLNERGRLKLMEYWTDHTFRHEHEKSSCDARYPGYQEHGRWLQFHLLEFVCIFGPWIGRGQPTLFATDTIRIGR